MISFGSLTYRGLPETVSATIGDAIHNLRASLDLMAADMALRNGQSTKGLSFPFADSEEAL
ncbi:hypothetical protein KC221_30040, partial [Mycobacterium tuberculosis]|nr:hypothetical protein [Mycobacterium tuberculosis]